MNYDNESIVALYNSSLREWISIAERQKYSSDYLFPKIFDFLRADKYAPILELGSGVGQLAKIALKHGYKVLGSDYADAFVAHMKNEGIECRKIDALTVGNEEYKWQAIFTQGLSVLITKDMATVELAYRSIYKALQAGGRLVFLFPRGDKSKYSRANEHRPVYLNVGFREIKTFRQQAFPAALYKFKIVHFFESLVGSFIGVRNVIVLEKPS
ncbi:MAG: methyltransferase domain-containing protein [Methylococcaceae bacterium]|nr:methyltransferase domain-containing protein [Methylococcaceae bacterium]